jgi:hypothetical protein
MQDGQSNLLEGGDVAENDKIGNNNWTKVITDSL